MNQFENEKSKQQNLNNDIDLYGFGAAAGAQNQVSKPEIFKLNAICCDDLFEWLSFKDLQSLGQTCKRMYRLTGLYFQENFREMPICRDQNIECHDIQLNNFIEFVERISFKSATDSEYIGASCDTLRHIYFQSIQLTKDIIDGIKVKLDKIEKIWMPPYQDSPSIQIYEDLLKFCPNLKEFRVIGSSSSFENVDNEWMCHKYPKLECLKFEYIHNFSNCKPLEIFFQINTHLQIFRTNHRFLLNNRYTFINSKLKLNLLVIFVAHRYSDDNIENTCTLLNELYENGIYKRLQFGFGNRIQGINSVFLLPGLEKLSTFFEIEQPLPLTDSVRDLSIHSWRNNNFEAITGSFSNLRELHLYKASEAEILPLIRRLVKLKSLIINQFDAGNEYHMDLATLSNERKKLSGACKVTIYTTECIYLETKMAPKNMYANLNLIEIKRIQSGDFRDRMN